LGFDDNIIDCFGKNGSPVRKLSSFVTKGFVAKQLNENKSSKLNELRLEKINTQCIGASPPVGSSQFEVDSRGREQL
jgi:hypothetical protein